MAFWTDIGDRNRYIPEPLRQNRWYINFNNPTSSPTGSTNLSEYIYALKECSKPEYKIETSQHVLINHTFNYPKNVVWQPITVKMISSVDNETSLASTFNNILLDAGYSSPNKLPNKQISKKSLSFQRVEIVQIDEEGSPIEAWNLYNSFITNVNYGALTYESDGFVDITFGIVYDYAELNRVDSETVQKVIEEIKKSIAEGRNPEPIVYGGEAEGQNVYIGNVRGT